MLPLRHTFNINVKLFMLYFRYSHICLDYVINLNYLLIIKVPGARGRSIVGITHHRVVERSYSFMIAEIDFAAN